MKTTETLDGVQRFQLQQYLVNEYGIEGKLSDTVSKAGKKASKALGFTVSNNAFNYACDVLRIKKRPPGENMRASIDPNRVLAVERRQDALDKRLERIEIDLGYKDQNGQWIKQAEHLPPAG